MLPHRAFPDARCAMHQGTRDPGVGSLPSPPMGEREQKGEGDPAGRVWSGHASCSPGKPLHDQTLIMSAMSWRSIPFTLRPHHAPGFVPRPCHSRRTPREASVHEEPSRRTTDRPIGKGWTGFTRPIRQLLWRSSPVEQEQACTSSRRSPRSLHR